MGDTCYCCACCRDTCCCDRWAMARARVLHRTRCWLHCFATRVPTVAFPWAHFRAVRNDSRTDNETLGSWHSESLCSLDWDARVKSTPDSARAWAPGCKRDSTTRPVRRIQRAVGEEDRRTSCDVVVDHLVEVHSVEEEVDDWAKERFRRVDR